MVESFVETIHRCLTEYTVFGGRPVGVQVIRQFCDVTGHAYSSVSTFASLSTRIPFRMLAVFGKCSRPWG